MEDQKDKHDLPAPAPRSHYLHVAERILSKSFLFFLGLNSVAIIGGVFLKPHDSTKIVFLMELLVLTSLLVRNKNANWTHLLIDTSLHKNPVVISTRVDNKEVKASKARILTALRALVDNKDFSRAVGCILVSYLVAELVQLTAVAERSGGLANDVALAITLSAMFPLSAAFSLKFQRKIIKATDSIMQSGSLMKISLLRLVTNVHVPNFSYSCCYAGFTYLFFLLSYLPHGLGHQFSGWLHACMNDAHLPVSNEPSLAMQVTISSILFVSLMSVFRQGMVRFSAGFQLFLKRAIVFNDSLLDAFRATVKVNALRVDLPDRHPHLHNAFSTLLWICFIYAVLFCLVAFCPGPIGETIQAYYQHCLREANFSVDLGANPGLLTFIASIVAAYATVPVAVMSCAFLPNKKLKYILASPEGILAPFTPATLIGASPILSWDKLTRVSLEHEGIEKKQYLKFSFDQAIPIKLKVADSKKESLAALLNSADEHSKKCLIERPVLDLRQRLIDETMSHTLAETKRFSSTVFSLLKPGDDLCGNYRIVRKLAGKSLSAVYLARNAANELVVIKEFILPDKLEDCDRLDATFEREYKMLKELQHVGIAKVLGSFEERTAKYLVIEHIAGTDLRELVNKSGKRGESSVKSWSLSIAAIMVYLHAQEPAILHRDLTPDNLMVNSEGLLKLIDFGASHQFIEGVTGTLIGKQCYIAPEQLRGKPCVESDIYSFGCTLYFLLTGVDPKALQQSDLVQADISVSQSLRQLILKCTEFEPANRFHSFTEVIASLSDSAPPAYLIGTDGSDSTPLVEKSFGH